MNKLLTSRAAFALFIALAAALLYSPFLGNVVLFDDHNFFKPAAIHELVKTPFNFEARTFAYFTLAEVQILFGSVGANRIVNLGLHVFCGWILFVLLEALLEQALSTSSKATYTEERAWGQPRVIAFLGATWFVLNPVAVYTAGYLAQRTIVFATLFSLSSLWYYRRAFAENRTGNIVAAALFFSAAVFSKEHAVMVPAATVMITPLYVRDLRASWKRIALYLVLCAPAAITVVLEMRHIVGNAYEPVFGAILSQIHGIPLLDKPHGPWMVSSAFQTTFFFDYLGYWLVPNVHAMSIDMRVDFEHMWAAWWLFPKALLFFAVAPVGLYLLRRRGLAALFGCGLLYAWLLFFTELVSVRFQEPFVLYRSYLWAPGYMLMLVAVLAALPRRMAVVVASVPVLALFVGLSYERLGSLRSEFSVWNDAANKLVSQTVPGADRIFYNRGLPNLRAKKYNEALADFSQAAALRPAAHYFYHRGVVYYWLNEFVKAEADFNRAFALNSKDGAIQFARGLAFERRGCLDQAKDAYSKSFGLGFATAKLRLTILAKNREAGAAPVIEPASCAA